MIKEDYVSFEVAKLLKEKGFDEPVMYHFTPDGTQRKFQQAFYRDDVAQPTLQVAMKWLREVHGLHIDVFVGVDESYDADGVMVDEWHFWTYRITTIEGEFVYDAYDQFDVVEHQTYEEAVESAILFCLNNLI
jgi:hypothetical protein